MKVIKIWSYVISTFLLYGFLIAGLMFGAAWRVNAAVGINNQIHFQGKVVNNVGKNNVLNGSYDFSFKIYTAASGGVAVWTENKTITVTNGIFQTYLGSSTSLPGSVDFNNDELYVGVTFNNDGEMSPRIRLSAVPYAMNAAKVAGLTVTNSTGTLTILDGKTVSFADSFTTSGAYPLTLTTTGTTSIILPTTGTLGTLLGVETLNNKSIGSAGLVISGATTDITSGTNEDITINANGSGGLVFNDKTTIGAGKAFIITGGSGDPTATEGTVWYDSTAHKFKVVEGLGIKILCNKTDLGCGAGSGGGTLNGLTGAAGTNTIDNATYAQTWTWNTATTQTGMTLSSTSLTSGGLLAVNSSAASNFTGSLVSIGLTDATGASSNTGSALTITNSGTANSNSALTIQNNATGTNSLSLQVNDEASDTTPTVIDSYGRLGLGTAAPQSLLQVGSGSNNGDVKMYGDLTKEGYDRYQALPNIIDTYVYDTARDNDSGDWVWRTANSTWATETKDDGLADPCVVSTDDRCGQNMFPQKAILVTTTNGLYIFNAKDNSLWMKFSQSGTFSLGADTNNDPSGVMALNGVIYVGTNGSSGSGMYAFDFINDQMYRYTTTGRVQAVESIAARNTTVSYSLNTRDLFAIIDNVVNDVHATVIVASTSSNGTNGTTLVGAATDNGFSVIQLNRGQTNSYANGAATNDYQAIYLTKRGRAYAVNETAIQLERWDNMDVDTASELPGSTNKTWDELSTPPIAKNAFTFTTTPDVLDVIEQGSYATNSDDIIYVGTSQGLAEIHNATNSWSRLISTTRQTDIMPVTIRGMFGFDDTSGDATDYSFRNNVLQPLGTITYRADGVRGRAVTFNGVSPTKFCSDTNNDGTCDVDTDYNPGILSFTISFWFKRSGNPATPETLVEKILTTAAAVDPLGGYRVTLNTNGTLSFDIDDDATTFPEDTALSTASYADGEWHNVVASKNGTTSISLYVDGNLVAQDASLSSVGSLGTTSVFAVGGSCNTVANCAGGTQAFNGSIDELRVSMGGTGTVDLLTNTHINQIYTVGRAALAKRDISVTDATTFSSTTLGDSGESWIPGEFSGLVVELTGGTGSGQTRQVIANTATTLTVSPAWSTTPDTTTDFAIKPETLAGSSDMVTSVNVENPQTFGQGYKIYVGTNNGADGGAVTVFNRDSFIKTDAYHADAGKVDDYGNAWTGTGRDNMTAIGASGNTVVFSSSAGQWSSTDAFTLQGVRDHFDKIADQFRTETLRDTITGLGLEVGMLGGADLAEYYTSGQNLRPGDIVALSGEDVAQNIERTSQPYDLKTIGVVATQPGLILGPMENNSYPVALVGRVPVRVTTENGLIKAGDQVTSSTLPGYGMVADQAGIVIGKALEDLDPNTFTTCPSDGRLSPEVQCGEVTVFVNLSQSLGVPIDAMIDRNPRLVLSGVEEDVLPSMLNTAEPDQRSILKKLQANLRERVLSSTSSTATQTLRVDRVQANRDIIAPTVIADMIVARSIRADKIEGLELFTNRIDTLSQDLVAQMKSIRSAQSSTQSASLSASLAQSVLFSDPHVLGTLFDADELELKGLTVNKKASFKGETFFDRAVEFASNVIFSDDIDIKGLTYLAEDSIGEVILQPNTLKTTVKFKKPYEYPPIVSVTMNIDWAKLNTATQQRLKQALAKGEIQYYVIDRTTDDFTISVRQPQNIPLSFTWTAWPVKDDFLPTLSSPAPAQQSRAPVEYSAPPSTSTVSTSSSPTVQKP